ncbi:hypothetical protein NDU88_006130 [Pleurodeles waltl]|uniref:Uncharacterized protein n=1 Tax=Pleurodeles waltl TaxID=8319 RepID=A0AAV7SNP9_PLEWA|nr:hypothetical protein NDU88_006130 [Pleurodeles waltl]
MEEVSTAQTELSVLKAKANQRLSKTAVTKYQMFKAECYEYGEATGKVLARRIRQKAVDRDIAAFKDSYGRKLGKPKEILNVFRDFYEELYSDDIELAAVVHFLSVIIKGRVSLTPVLVLLEVVDSAEENGYVKKERYFLFMAMAILRLCIASDWIKEEHRHWKIGGQDC